MQTSLLANQAMNFLVGGAEPRRTGNAHPNIQPQDVFACSDGRIALAVGNDKQFRSLADLLGCPELADDERFATNSARVRHLGELRPLLDERLVKESRAHWVERMAAGGVPCGPINTVSEALDEPNTVLRGMVADLPHSTHGQVASRSQPDTV